MKQKIEAHLCKYRINKKFFVEGVNYNKTLVYFIHRSKHCGTS